ncbi:ran-binding protein 3 isoform X4 [Zootermopsis nevadensis]|uniref:ran-binding protein 3 isoform X4 n=1 Tax=Zootermopsis nevadensis TaxID=136037 RepID=UPI000B8E26BF|nr:ran-binding protein 3 isoform X4 [Zootermopsis nevadensis]
MADLRNDTASPMDGQTGNSNNMQERSLLQKSNIVMKVDVPEEETATCKNEGKKAFCSPATYTSSSGKPIFGSSGKIGSSVLASAHLSNIASGGNPFAIKPAAFGTMSKLSCAISSSLPKPVVLRPSQLAFATTDSSQQATSHCTLSLKLPSVGNPFARVPQDSVSTSATDGIKNEDNSASSSEEVGACGSSSSPETCSTSTVIETVGHKENRKGAAESNSEEVDRGSVTSCGSQKNLTEIISPPKFVPLGTPSCQTEESSSPCGSISSASAVSTTTSTAVTSSSTSASVTEFVFGQNLHERVAEAASLETTDTSRTCEGTETSNSISTVCASATANGISEMLFTSVIKKDQNNESSHMSSNNTIDIAEKPSKSLSEAAREYEEARAVKRKYEEVTIVTGEEDEANVLQINCKLFAFDKAGGTWVERGRGTLRLNDKDSGPGGGGVQSRVVIRTAGSLRVVLNTKIWAGMSVHRPSAKSVRLTAMDSSGQIKVFLVMSSPADIEQLHKSLESRVLLAQQAASLNQQTQPEAETTHENVASHSLPPEPCSKKRLSQGVEDTSPSSPVHGSTFVSTFEAGIHKMSGGERAEDGGSVFP